MNEVPHVVSPRVDLNDLEFLALIHDPIGLFLLGHIDRAELCRRVKLEALAVALGALLQDGCLLLLKLDLVGNECYLGI